MSTVVPLVLASCAMAPALSSTSITASLPCLAAMNSGVIDPMRVDALTLAPAFSSAWVISTSP